MASIGIVDLEALPYKVGIIQVYTTCMGIEHAEDQLAEKGEPTIENAMRLRGILEGEQQCPFVGKSKNKAVMTAVMTVGVRNVIRHIT